MGLIKWLKGVINDMFKTELEKVFDTEVYMTDKMENAINLWQNITSGEPPWKNKEDDIDTINFAAFIAKDVAKKVCLDIDINVTGARGEYLQKIVDKLMVI